MKLGNRHPCFEHVSLFLYFITFLPYYHGIYAQKAVLHTNPAKRGNDDIMKVLFGHLQSYHILIS